VGLGTGRPSPPGIKAAARDFEHSALDYRTAEIIHCGRNRDEGRGGLGERGLVSPKSKNNRGAAAPAIINYH
jgi:hypothetical protein